MGKRLTTEEFIRRAKEIHGNKYDYSKVEYKGAHEHVCIVCPEHGEFMQAPANHISLENGCPKCGDMKKSLANRDSLENFVKKARSVHGDKYGYNEVKYVNNHTKVKIWCKKCKKYFYQTPHAHLQGQGCPICGSKLLSEIKTKSLDDFINDARKVHGDKYDYSRVEYKGNDEFVCIICPEHGEFMQTPHSHLNGNGCSICNESKLERQVRLLLSNIDLVYDSEKCFDWLVNECNNKLKCDFYIPSGDIVIECHGEQHFQPVDFFGGVDRFESVKKNDDAKHNICQEYGIEILYFADDEDYIRGYRYPVITDIDDLKAEILKRIEFIDKKSA